MTKPPSTPLPRDRPTKVVSLALRLRRVFGIALGGGAIAVCAAGGGDPLAGRSLAAGAAPACGGCHGVAGAGKADAPRLAGLDAAYLREQLARYAKGTRRNDVMSKIAAAMDATAVREAAAYFAGLPAPAASSPNLPPNAQLAAGARLALRGDWSAGIPPCAACHGNDGRGVGTTFPAIAGQPAAFTTAQLEAWRSGRRNDDPQELMRKAAAHLSDAQIAAVAAYYALPPGARAVPPDPTMPDDALGRTAARGEAIFRDPTAHAAAFVGNVLTCDNCHLDAGRLADSGPMGAAYVAYPAYRKKEGHVVTFAERLRGCFLYSMNGTPPPFGDETLVALESYAFVLAKGLPTGAKLPGRGYARLAPPRLGLDFARGATIFAARCAICHADDGRGRTAGGRTVFPPLWGPNSFNWGAGMSSVDAAAAFIKANMPFGEGFSLSDQEAWDVATFVDGHERPQDPRFTGDVATTRQRFHDDPMSLYGQTVAGVLLGRSSPPAGREARAGAP